MVPEATMATTREVVAEEDCGGEHCGYLPQVIPTVITNGSAGR